MQIGKVLISFPVHASSFMNTKTFFNYFSVKTEVLSASDALNLKARGKGCVDIFQAFHL
jgi:hypothetical protein